jgi:hypothetical protein
MALNIKDAESSEALIKGNDAIICPDSIIRRFSITTNTLCAGFLALCRDFLEEKIPQPPSRVPRAAFSREELLMQLLAAEHSEEEPDGELSGSGDDCDGDD